MPPIVHDQGDRFDERNLFLQSALGLLSFALRFRAAAVRHGTLRPAPPRAAHGEEDEDPVLLLLLGVAALGERVVEVLEQVRSLEQETAPAAAPARDPGRDGAAARHPREILA